MGRDGKVAGNIVKNSRKQTQTLRFACRRLAGECSQEPHLPGSEESRTNRKRLDGDAVTQRPEILREALLRGSSSVSLWPLLTPPRPLPDTHINHLVIGHWLFHPFDTHTSQ